MSINPKDLPDEEFTALRNSILDEADRRTRVDKAKKNLYEAYYRATRSAGMTKEEVITFIKEAN